MNEITSVTGVVERPVIPDTGGELHTYLEWKARGRQVRSGERGIKRPAWQAADGSPVNAESTGANIGTMVTVFSLSQTRAARERTIHA